MPGKIYPYGYSTEDDIPEVIKLFNEHRRRLNMGSFTINKKSCVNGNIFVRFKSHPKALLYVGFDLDRSVYFKPEAGKPEKDLIGSLGVPKIPDIPLY